MGSMHSIQDMQNALPSLIDQKRTLSKGGVEAGSAGLDDADKKGWIMYSSYE